MCAFASIPGCLRARECVGVFVRECERGSYVTEALQR